MGMVMGCDIIDSWTMNHFAKLRDIDVKYNPWKSGLTQCLGLALFKFGNEMVSSANREV